MTAVGLGRLRDYLRHQAEPDSQAWFESHRMAQLASVLLHSDTDAVVDCYFAGDWATLAVVDACSAYSGFAGEAGARLESGGSGGSMVRCPLIVPVNRAWAPASFGPYSTLVSSPLWGAPRQSGTGTFHI